MDLTDHRMACLRMAFELQGKHDHVLASANDLMAFVTGAAAATAEPAAAMTEAAADPTDESPPRHVAEEAIAACGTALEMPAGGDLADAAPGGSH